MDKPDIDPQQAKLIRDLLYVCLAFFAGLIGYLFRSMEARKKIKFLRGMLEGFGSAFTGYLVLLLCHSAGFGEEVTGVLVGTFGWLGASATIRLLEKWAYKQLGVDISIDSAPPLQERSDDNSSSRSSD